MMSQAALTRGINTLAYPIQNIAIDPSRIRADYETVVTQSSWKKQNVYMNPGWEGIALYSPSGRSDDLTLVRHPPVERTPAGSLCSYTCEELLPQFGARWLRVAFYKLEAGKKIGEHRDLVHEGFRRMTVRIHMPVITNERVVMYVDRRPYYFAPGTAWYFDPTARHKVENNSNEDRIHLMADFLFEGTLQELLKTPTSQDRLRFAWMSFRYYTVGLGIKPIYSRVRKLSHRLRTQ
jgi:hypothetical protein